MIRVWEERRDATWRLVGEANDGGWTQALREQFLLRMDASPISADRYVSPEVEPETPGAIELRLLTPSLIEGDPVAEEAGVTPPEGWLLLGYDVCDASLLSGLTNCGYSPAERDELARVWGTRLNRWHLLEGMVAAEDFRALSDKRVPEHAPFQVVAVLARETPFFTSVHNEATQLD
ncbi:MAG TPA: hypothetical protein VHP33_20265 [Polyangiaceae bacterium]|nr:hypothetical protein [Polyangiaceae bacterium]